MTAPERMCAPTSEPFSTTTTLMSGDSCLSRMAAARPAGPAPTITTRNSIASRGGSSSSAMSISSKPAARFSTFDKARQSARTARRMTPDRAKAARELLAFYVEAGVDLLVADEPTNWLADPSASDVAEPQPPPPREQSFSPPANERRPRELPSLPPKDRPGGAERNAAAAPLAPDVAR